jgi:hypothetical protein
MSEDEIVACREHYDLVGLPDRAIVGLCSNSSFLAVYRFNRAWKRFTGTVMKVLMPFGRK